MASVTTTQCNLPGTKEEDCFAWPYNTTEVPFSAQSYLQSLLRTHRFDLPQLLRPPPQLDPTQWLSEHLRQLCIELGFYLTHLHADCTEKTCPIMCAQEMTYYCAGHGSPRPCSAMGYSVHTLDYAVRQLAVGAGMKHFQSMVRRLYRIFAHVYFHHREVFESQESARGVYAWFVAVVRKYELSPESLIIIPEMPSTVKDT
ncbi:Mob1/phocein [Kickxella alabastrina]|uniref:Mob1/phocein n=1 Tax=Kickxella alabastrina TaxID=61397 RepID=UPI0022205D57|nr:Mob1/phocein [Kickxella alabastrina]KAI7821271.1 Mob1/phocein [Kickxella alabastrina]